MQFKSICSSLASKGWTHLILFFWVKCVGDVNDELSILESKLCGFQNTSVEKYNFFPSQVFAQKTLLVRR